MTMQYIRKAYDVPAKRGMRVTVNGQPGTIAGSDGQYIKVRYDGDKFTRRCHPTWHVEYHPSPPVHRDKYHPVDLAILGGDPSL